MSALEMSLLILNGLIWIKFQADREVIKQKQGKSFLNHITGMFRIFSTVKYRYDCL